MYVIREVMHCKPGKVRDMVGKFEALSAVVEKRGHAPFRIMTDVSGENFWTVVAETDTPGLAEFLDMEAEVMKDPAAQKAMEGYHDLVADGRREIYRVEG